MKNLVAVFSMTIVLFTMQIGLCNGGTINGDAETGDLSGWTGSASVAAVMVQPQTAGTVNPFQGDWFFTLASESAASAFLDQNGTSEIGDGPVLRLTGAYQTESDDLGEAVITLLDAGNTQVAQQTTGPLSTPNLEWLTFSVDIAVPATAASWNVELRGTLNTGSFVNVFYDDIRLEAVPEPSTFWMLSLAALVPFHRLRGRLSHF